MKIPLTIRKIAGGDRLVIYLHVKIPPRFFKIIPFIIDTGSPRSLICGADMKLLQIPDSILEFVEGDIVIGNTKVTLYKVNKAMKLSMRNEENKSNEIEYSLFIAPQHPYPSVLGTDFLAKNNLVLHFDAANNIGYLEDVSLIDTSQKSDNSTV